MKHLDNFKIFEGKLKEAKTTINIPLFEEFLNESKNNSDTYPVKTERDVLRLLSGKSNGGWVAHKYQDELIDVFGDDASILSGDEVTMYYQSNSTDDSLIFRVIRKNLQFSRTFYIPSKFQAIDQYDTVESTR